MTERIVRIGGPGRNREGIGRMIDEGGLDCLVLGRPDFIASVPLLRRIAEARVRVIATGSADPAADRASLERCAAEAGIRLGIAVVLGGDLRGEAAALGLAPVTRLDARLGAAPIAGALVAGADLVLAGPSAPGAPALAALVHAFAWSVRDWGRLAAGLLCGRLLDAGPEDLLADCAADGSCIVAGPTSPLDVGLRMLDRLGDPAVVAAPDVTADFTAVRLAEIAPGRVVVEGARGRPPGGHYAALASRADGFGGTARLTVVGPDALARAEAYAEAALGEARALLDAHGLAPFRLVAIQPLGAEHLYGPNARPEARTSREIALRVDLEHESAEAIALFAEAWPEGERPLPVPLHRAVTLAVPMESAPVRVELDGRELPVRPPPQAPAEPAPPPAPERDDEPETELLAGETARVPLAAFAVARSTAEAERAEIGVIARRPEFLAVIRASLSAEAVRAWFAHLVDGDVERFELPGIDGLVFVLHDAALRAGPPADGWAAMLLDYEIEVPAWWVVPGSG